jgi:hypothetical protein
VDDPRGPTPFCRPVNSQFFRNDARGGPLNNLVLSACNAFRFGPFCDTASQAELSAAFMSSVFSRVPLCVLLAFATLLMMPFAQQAARILRLASLLSPPIWRSSHGEYRASSSFLHDAAVLVLCVRILARGLARKTKALLRSLLFCLLAVVPAGRS